MSTLPVAPHYVETITQVLHYIDEHLESDLSIESLAEVALLSKFHFHRIFKGAVGETLNAYVSRRRLERAAQLLKRDATLAVTEVALRVGYQSPEHFSRAFKQRFGFTAQALRRSDASDPRSLKNSKIYQEVSEGSFYHIYQQSRNVEPPEFQVDVRQRHPESIAYITGVFGDDGSRLVQAYLDLMSWGDSRGLTGPDMQRLAISRDDVEITPAEQYRVDFCLVVPDGTPGDGPVAIKQIVGGPYALIHVEGDIERVAQAWDYLYKVWLPRSSYVPRDEPAIENFLQGPETIGWERFDLEVGIPLQAIP